MVEKKTRKKLERTRERRKCERRRRKKDAADFLCGVCAHADIVC